jgi:hypothetical protein
MSRTTALLWLLVGGLLLPGCQNNSPEPAPPAATFPGSEDLSSPRILIVQETQGPGGAFVAESCQALEILLAHFEEGCNTVGASEYEKGQAGDYEHVFYFGGKQEKQARAAFAEDAADYRGTVTWVGPGATTLGESKLAELGLSAPSHDDALVGPVEWTIGYGQQRHVEQLYVPAVRAEAQAKVRSEARRGAERRPFLAGDGKLWYVAAGPSLAEERLWTACIWADALHDILGQPHSEHGRRMVAALRDVPVWATEQQVPKVIRRFLDAGLPVLVLAWTQMGEVPLAERPDAVRGLRTAEAMGATVALAASTGVDALEQFRLAWEVRLHPVAWLGPANGTNPFRLRIAEPDASPAYCAGGLLPAPIPISDAGYIAPEDAERLRMQEVVRDAVALLSFGLWAPPEPFLAFVRGLRAKGWQVTDARDLGAEVSDPRRRLVSGKAKVRLPTGVRVRTTVLGPRWQVAQEELLPAGSEASAEYEVVTPGGHVAILEPVRERGPGGFVKGVTLDPWAYSHSGMSATALAQALAERYSRNGVNTVFFYAYNVKEGAAYRTRYRGALVGEWGRQDLLGHVLRECHARKIRVVAWLYSGRDRRMWLEHPEWRERTKDGKEYNPLRLHAAYFLCPRNPDVRRWYVGLLRDLARRYPELDGIELCEPVVNWFGEQACHCEVCTREFAAAHPGERRGGSLWRRFRSQGLTDFLVECMQAVRREGIETYIMTLSDAWSNGAILSARRQAEECGLDLEALLDSESPPDWLNFEVIWQQWAAIYGEEIFNYDWATEVAHRLVRRADGRARVIFHVELSDFGSQRMTPDKIAETIRRVTPAGPHGIDCYHSAALDRRAGWRKLSEVYEELE